MYLTRAPLVVVRGLVPLPFLLYLPHQWSYQRESCSTSQAINFTPYAPIQFRTYHRLAANDVRVTSCPSDFDFDFEESLSCSQILSFSQFLCMQWRGIERPTNLLSQIFKILKSKKEIFDKLKKMIFSNNFCFVEKNGTYLIEPIKMNQFGKFHLDMSNNGWLIRHFVVLYTGYGKNSYNLNPYLSMLRTSHNKIKGTIGFLS